MFITPPKRTDAGSLGSAASVLAILSPEFETAPNKRNKMHHIRQGGSPSSGAIPRKAGALRFALRRRRFGAAGTTGFFREKMD